ncbi:MAG: large subunit ribosomal protein L25 [Hyphomonadaceae bacterium]|nr:MAG: large subunit ribosomal protein L25 [Hyphomonadaceae bacterium]
MTGIVINVDVREQTGTGSARAVRRLGNVPGILYGGSLPPVAIAAKQNELLKAIRSGKFIAHMVELEYSGERQPVIPKAIQWDPLTDMPVHFDLYRVEANSVINVDVPVHFKNHDICPGLKRGGVLNVVSHTVSLDVLASNIPEEIVIDLKGFEMGHVFHVSDLKLPEGARPHHSSRDATIATIASRGGSTAAEATEEGEEGEAEA